MKNKSIRFYGVSGLVIGLIVILLTLVTYSIPSKQIGRWTFWQSVSGFLMMTGGLLFIVGGIGILRNKNWGKLLTIVMDLLLILGLTALIILEITNCVRFGGSIVNFYSVFLVIIILFLIWMIRNINIHLKENKAI